MSNDYWEKKLEGHRLEFVPGKGGLGRDADTRKLLCEACYEFVDTVFWVHPDWLCVKCKDETLSVTGQTVQSVVVA